MLAMPTNFHSTRLYRQRFLSTRAQVAAATSKICDLKATGGEARKRRAHGGADGQLSAGGVLSWACI
jgi:hypothetical protein